MDALLGIWIDGGRDGGRDGGTEGQMGMRMDEWLDG